MLTCTRPLCSSLFQRCSGCFSQGWRQSGISTKSNSPQNTSSLQIDVRCEARLNIVQPNCTAVSFHSLPSQRYWQCVTCHYPKNEQRTFYWTYKSWARNHHLHHPGHSRHTSILTRQSCTAGIFSFCTIWLSSVDLKHPDVCGAVFDSVDTTLNGESGGKHISNAIHLEVWHRYYHTFSDTQREVISLLIPEDKQILIP